MKKTVKIWLITATALVLSGILLCVSAAAAVGFDINKLSTVKFTTNTHTVTADFQNISVDTATADVSFVVSDTKTCRVECYEQEKVSHTVEVKNSTLIIRCDDNRKWYDFINISFSSPKVTVFLNKTDYASLSVKGHTGNVTIPDAFRFDDVSVNTDTGNITCGGTVKNALKITASTGNIRVNNLTAGEAKLSASTGNITLEDVKTQGALVIDTSTGNDRLSDVTCQSLRATASTGSITLIDTVAAEGFSLECSTGDIRFARCDATEITAKTGTGDVTGTLRSEKIFFAKSSTGDVDVPHGTKGGTCDITTSTGDIRISIDE